MSMTLRESQRHFEERAKAAKRGTLVAGFPKDFQPGLRSRTKGRKQVISASKSEEKCPTHYRNKRARARRRAK